MKHPSVFPEDENLRQDTRYDESKSMSKKLYNTNFNLDTSTGKEAESIERGQYRSVKHRRRERRDTCKHTGRRTSQEHWRSGGAVPRHL
jgi:hypothetical protein